jgi:hypothetical protein
MLMKRNQFQPSLSTPQLFEHYEPATQCGAAFKTARRKEGFRCSRCAAAHRALRGAKRTLFPWNACRHQTSLIAGTIFQNTKLGLMVRLIAIYLISQAKTALSVLALKRQLGVSDPTAWRIQHRLMQAMAARKERRGLECQIQVDNAHLGGERGGGKAGRGSEKKVLSVAAISLNDEGHRLHVELSTAAGSPARPLQRGPARHGQPPIRSPHTATALACRRRAP